MTILSSQSEAPIAAAAPLPPPPPENRAFFPALDGLRALAVLLVFSQHYLAADYPALGWGWTGVDIFFVLSGFLITGILYDTRNTAHPFRVFYMRRTLRIFPLYYGVLFAALLTTPIFHWFWNGATLLWFVYLGNYARFFFAHSSLVQPGGGTGLIDHLFARPIHPEHPVALLLSHFWSLCVEEQFYLVWPFIVLTVRNRVTLRNLCLLSLPLALAARILCLFTVPHIYISYELLYRATPLRADALLLGGALALMLRGPEASTLRRLAAPGLLLAVLGFAAWFLTYRLVHGAFYVPFAGAPILSTLGYTLIDLASAALILNLLDLRNPLARCLNLAPLRGLGRISYGFYVFHDIFRLFLVYRFARLSTAHHTLGLGAVTLTGLALTLVLATLSYRFYELPFLRLKRFFTAEPAHS